MEKAFFWFEVEVVELCDFEDVMNCVFMICKVCTSGDSDVVHVDSNRSTKRFMFEDNVAIYVVHHGLECRWGVGESKIHDCRFEEPISGFKCHFWFIPFTDAHVIVAPSNIKFGVYVRIAKVSNKVCYKRKGVLVSDGDGIDLSIVLHWSHFAVLFANKEE